MAGTVENTDHEVGDLDRLGLGQAGQIVRRLGVDIDDAVGQSATHGDFVHINVGGVQKAPVAGHRNHRQGVGAALRCNRRPFQRVEGDIDLGPIAGADLLADKQHRRLVAFALADDDGAVDTEDVERLPHGVDGSLVGGHFVAPAHQPRRRQGRGLGDANDFQRQIAVHGRGVLAHPASDPSL